MNNILKLLIILILPYSFTLSMDNPIQKCEHFEADSWIVITPHNPCNHLDYCGYCCPERVEHRVKRCFWCYAWLGAPPEFIAPTRTTQADLFASYCKTGNSAEVEAYLKKGFNPNYIHRDYKTPLMIAAEKGHLPIVEALIAAGADLNVVSSHGGTTALIEAIASTNDTHIEIIKRLLAAKANPDIHGRLTLPPIHVALRVDRREVVELLLKANANPNHDDPLSRAGNDQEMIALLKQYGAKPRQPRASI